jgi:hypothetical protein
MSFFDLFKEKNKKESIESSFKNIFNRTNRIKISRLVKELNKSRFKPGIIFKYNRFSTLITCEYSDDSAHYGGDNLGYLKVKIPQKSGWTFYKSLDLEGIVPSPGNFGEIEAKIIFKNNKFFLQIDIKSKKNYENGRHARYDYESKTFNNILKTQPIIDFLIKKIQEFNNLDKS